MRQRLGNKKLRKLEKELGFPIVAVLVRGGTEHRKDLCLENGMIKMMWFDKITQRNEFFDSSYKWSISEDIMKDHEYRKKYESKDVPGSRAWIKIKRYE